MPDQRGELPRRQPTSQFGVDGTTLMNENRTVAISLRRELQKQRLSGGRFPFGDESFANQRLNGAMHDGAVQSEQRGDPVLVQRGAPAQCREDKPTRLRTPGFLLHAPSDMEVGGGQLDENRVLPDFFRDEFMVYKDHRMVTVDSRGRRHCG